MQHFICNNIKQQKITKQIDCMSKTTKYLITKTEIFVFLKN